jgi:hypothetical protein
MRAVEVVLEGDVEGVEFVSEYVDSRVARLGTTRALAGVVDEYGSGGIGARAFEGEVGLVDDDLLAVGAGGDEYSAAGRRYIVDCRLHGLVLRRSVSSDVKRGAIVLGVCGGDEREDYGDTCEMNAFGTSHSTDEDSPADGTPATWSLSGNQFVTTA